MKLFSTFQKTRAFTLIELLLALFLGLLLLGVFINFTNLSSNSLKFYREKSENEIDYARDFFKKRNRIFR